MSRPPATVSIDVDPVDLHLAGYGHRGLEPDARAYSRALPRLLDLLARLGAPATFFVVARDAEREARRIREIAGTGHEVASHSLTHPMPFLRLPRDRLARELVESRRLLEAAAGGPVVGFRAPHWDGGARLRPLLLEAGYRYDASAFPSPLLPGARLALALRGRPRLPALALRFLPFTWRRRPWEWAPGLQEFPLSVTPRLRIPLYHTTRPFIGARRFEAHLDGQARRGEPLSYALHAVDALGLEEDGVDKRLGRHPGMDRPLPEKLRLLEETLRAITTRFEVRTFRDRLPGP